MKITKKQIKKMIKEELDDLLSRSYKFGPYFQKLKKMMVEDLEAYNQGVALFDAIKGLGMLNPEEEEVLQKISDYASAFHKHKSAKKYLESIKDFHPMTSRKREEIDQWKQANNEVKEAKAAMDRALNAFKYDRFSATITSSIRRNNK